MAYNGYMRRTGSQEFIVFSAEEQEKRTILKFQEEMLEQLNNYSMYALGGFNKSLEKERFQSLILKLYHKLRSHIITYFERRERQFEKRMKGKRKFPDKEQERITATVEEAKKYISILDEAYRVRLSDTALFDCVMFLDRFILDYGISRLEREQGDALESFSEEAYGKDYKEEAE